jgi:outer membrane protein TolC
MIHARRLKCGEGGCSTPATEGDACLKACSLGKTILRIHFMSLLSHFSPASFARLVLPFLAALFLGGCASLVPKPLTGPELAAGSAADRATMQKDIEPLKGPLTLEEAIARAIKYNLDRRYRMMEEALAAGQLEVGQYDMLPKVVASAGYRDRNNDLISRSKDSVTGQPSLANPYISSDRSATTTDLSFTWSLLDFGQSYYASKQNADRVLIAGERRRKALHNLIQDVRTAFWRTASAQKLRDDIRTTIGTAEQALDDSRKAESERLRNPVDALRYQRQLLENLRLLESIEQELSTARVELAALTNLPLVQNITVVEPANALDSPRWLGIPVERMEEQAILNNADLRESFYNARIASQETRRTLLKLFPGLSFSYSAKSSDDSYLINQHWTEAGAQLSFNLLGLLAAPAQMRLADAGVALADQRRMATQMAVLAQVHVARLQYGNAVRQFERADAIWKVDSGIADHIAKREQAQTQTKLDRVSNQTAAILSQLRRYHALSQVHAAASKLQATLGLEPAIDGSDAMPLPQLTQAVATSLQQWDAGKLDSPAPATPISSQ